MKECKDCKIAQPLDNFPHWKRKNGYIEVSSRCAECRSLYRSRYYEKNKERERETNRQWFVNNRPWDSQEKRDYINAWRRENKDKRRVETAARRALLAGAEGAFTIEEFLTLCQEYGNVCLACGEDGPLTVDHVVPISMGGSNFITNIQPLCQSCNSSKGTKTIDYRRT